VGKKRERKTRSGFYPNDHPLYHEGCREFSLSLYVAARNYRLRTGLAFSKRKRPDNHQQKRDFFHIFSFEKFGLIIANFNGAAVNARRFKFEFCIFVGFKTSRI